MLELIFMAITLLFWIKKKWICHSNMIYFENTLLAKIDKKFNDPIVQ